MKQTDGTIVYFNNNDEELWEEELNERSRVPNIGEEVIVLDCEKDVPNRKEGEYTWARYKVIDVTTHILISRGWNVFRHQYSVILKTIEEQKHEKNYGFEEDGVPF